MPTISSLQPLIDFVGYQKISYLFVFVAQTIFVLGFVYVNQHNFQPIESGLSRSIAEIIFNFILLKHSKLDMKFQNPKDFKILFLRSQLLTLFFVVFALTQFYLSQPIVQTINSCGPIFIFVLDYFINGVRITKNQFIGVILAIIGVLLTINGDYILELVTKTQEFHSDFENYATYDYSTKILMGFVMLAGVFCWAGGHIAVKRLSKIEAVQINLFYSFVLVLTNGCLYPLLVTNPVPPVKFLISIALSGFPMALSTLFFVTALKINQNSGMASMFVLSSVVVGYLLSIFRYNQHLNLISLLGTILIVISLGKILIKDKKEQKIIQTAK